MILFIIVLAALAYYFYRKAKNPGVYDSLSANQLFKRLWYLPIGQLAVAGILLLSAYMAVGMCVPKSPWLAPAIKENFGILGTIGADIINENLQSSLAPILRQADSLHKWSIYLLYATILSLGMQIYALKGRKVSMVVVLGVTGVISLVAIYLAYNIIFTLDMASGTVISSETFGLLSNTTAYAANEGLRFTLVLLAILIVLHFGHYNYITRYYGETPRNLNPMLRFITKQVSATAANMKNCPYCGEQIMAAAVKCKHCGEWLNKEPEPEQEVTAETPPPVVKVPVESKKEKQPIYTPEERQQLSMARQSMIIFSYAMPVLICLVCVMIRSAIISDNAYYIWIGDTMVSVPLLNLIINVITIAILIVYCFSFGRKKIKAYRKVRQDLKNKYV